MYSILKLNILLSGCLRSIVCQSGCLSDCLFFVSVSLFFIHLLMGHVRHFKSYRNEVKH